MNNEIYSRLENLMKCLHMSVEQGAYTRAEMKAYAAGIALAQEKMESVFKNLFIDSATDQGLSMFLSMIGENPSETQEASRQKIIDTVSSNKEIFSLSEFNEIVSSYGDITYDVYGNVVEFSFGIPFGREMLEILAKLASDIVPCTSIVCADGKGRSFKELEALALRWYEIDGFGLSFYALETL